MAASFEQLCAGFCEILRVTPPALNVDASGRVAFHVVLRGVTVNLVHCEQASADHLFLIFVLGPMPPEAAESHRALEALLDANFVLQVNAPVFSRNAATGDATLQQVVSLFDATPTGLHDLIEQGAANVAQWRERLATGWEADEDDAPQIGSHAMLNLA